MLARAQEEEEARELEDDKRQEEAVVTRMQRLQAEVMKYAGRDRSQLSALEKAAVVLVAHSDALRRRRERRKKRKKRRKRKLPRAPRPRCRRPCAHQQHVPAVQVVHVLEGAPASVHRQSGGHSCVACRDVYPQCGCSWTVPPPVIGGVGFGSSPNLDTHHTFYELCLPSERGCPDSAALCAARVFASRCRVVVVTPGGAYDSVWDSVLLTLLLS